MGWLWAGLVVLAVSVALCWALLAAVHLDDRYQVDHVSGARMALAQYFNDGILYPRLFDGEVYGGTRFMPLPIVLHGLVARATGEYLVSGKLLAYGVMLVLLAVVVLILRRLRCPLPLALALAGMVLVTKTGLAASMGLRADGLPLLMQVSAVAVVAHTRRPAPTALAAALAVLALLSKLNAVWAALAIGLWLAATDRRRLLWFAGVYAGLAAGATLFLNAVTDGRFAYNVFGLSTAGVTGAGSILRAPYVLVQLLVDQATGAWVLLPVVALLAWLARRHRPVTVYDLTLVCCLAVLVVTLTDIGTGHNQLVDLVVVVALVAGQLAGHAWPEAAAGDVVRAGLGLAVAWVVVGALAVTILPDAQPALASVRGGDAGTGGPPAQLTASSTVLSEDPYVPVSLGQVPVVLDPFMLLRIGRQRPAAISELIERIRAHEFDMVVTIVPLEPTDQDWWRRFHFGGDVVRALARAYDSAGRSQGYYLYEPRTS